MVTVFTPTYNRGYIISKLYDSLKSQSCKNFEWVVVDDGSTDDTEKLFEIFANENAITIKYFKKENSGKASAINTGVDLADGELFFIVDSDDYLNEDAIQQIEHHWALVDDKNCSAGLCFRRVFYDTGKLIGGELSIETGDFSFLDITFKLGLNCDRAEVFRTDVLKQYPFPKFGKETFVSESLIWNRTSRQYTLRFVNYGIYMCKYLEDGITKNFKQYMRQSPRGLKSYYSELLQYREVPFFTKAKALVRLFQCKLYIIISRKNKT